MFQKETNTCFVTIRIFARTEQKEITVKAEKGFVTIRIFARTEHDESTAAQEKSFVTIRIFARTELRLTNIAKALLVLLP